MRWLLFILLPSGCFSQAGYSIRDLKAGKFKEDSSYIYSLPFKQGKRVFLIQAYDSKMSHNREFALDFKVKKSTRIFASREGVVIGLREDSDRGGLKDENLSDGNYISIKHPDESIAHYWHLQKDGVLVNLGDTIKKRQAIAISGNTGYSAFPHLHLEVQGYDSNGNYQQLPTRFYTNKGIIYLRPGKFYRVVN
jgi:murein DD-endopeptidase MepM/ murein hydrolase activator NlpD